MRRRELLAGVAGLGVVGVGGAVSTGHLQLGDDANQIEPVTLPRIEAPGSPAGTEAVPRRGDVTFLELFATWCEVCQRNMQPLGEAAAAVEDDVQFVSVTNEPVGRTVSAERVAEWWTSHDGSWPVVHDQDLELTGRLDARSVPFAAVLDRENRITWTETGEVTAETLAARIGEAR